MITIVDYGLGNLGSMSNMLKKIGVPCRISADPADIRTASKLVLPGIGAFDQGMRSLRDRQLIEPLNQRVLQDRIPVIGVCLGMQLLGLQSEEGSEAGLGWIQARSIRIGRTSQCENVRVPHMGWNAIRVVRPDRIVEGLVGDARFYFVHSYHVVCENPDDVVATARYGSEISAIVSHDNVWGAQFHPEKSHKFGMQLLRNFAGLS